MYRFFFSGQPFHLFTNRGLLVSEFIYDTVFPAAEVVDRFANFFAIPIPRTSNVFRPSLRKNRFEARRVRYRASSTVIREVRPASVQDEFLSVFRSVSAGSRNSLANFDADPGIGPGRGHYGGEDRRGHGQVVASDERPDSRFFFDGGSLKGLPSRPDGIRVGEFRYRIGRNFREAVPAGFRIENPLVGDRFFRSRRDQNEKFSGLRVRPAFLLFIPERDFYPSEVRNPRRVIAGEERIGIRKHSDDRKNAQYGHRDDDLGKRKSVFWTVREHRFHKRKGYRLQYAVHMAFRKGFPLRALENRRTYGTIRHDTLSNRSHGKKRLYALGNRGGDRDFHVIARRNDRSGFPGDRRPFGR